MTFARRNEIESVWRPLPRTDTRRRPAATAPIGAAAWSASPDPPFFMRTRRTRACRPLEWRGGATFRRGRFGDLPAAGHDRISQMSTQTRAGVRNHRAASFLAMPARKSSAFMTGVNDIFAFRPWKNGSPIEGMSLVSFMSKKNRMLRPSSGKK